MPEIGIISKSDRGVDFVVEWNIKNFFTLSERDGAIYWSPNFLFGGERWNIDIFPNVWNGSDSSGHVDLRLWKYCSDRSINQSFSLSLKTAKGEKYNGKHFTKDFDNRNYAHRFNRFIPRSELTRRKSELVPEGVLTVVCIMKSSASAGSAKEEVRTAEVNKSDVAGSSKSEASGSSQAATTTTMESVLKWIKENCKEASKGKKRKTERENVLKWIEQNSNETPGGKKRKMEEKNGEACASGFSISPHEKKLAEDLKKLFLQNEDSDVIIKVKDSKFPAHRLILKTRSAVFASTFRHDMKESATGVVEIEDCDPSAFSDFLRFLYCADVEMISEENVFSLFTLSDKYEVLDLKAKCLDFIKKNMTVDTFCETITLALQHSETELIALATDFFVKNAEEILLTIKWQTFAAENPMQSNELFIKFVRSVKH